MSGEGVEYDAIRETLIDFAIWAGDSRADAEWSAETYLLECANDTLSRVPSTSEGET